MRLHGPVSQEEGSPLALAGLNVRGIIRGEDFGLVYNQGRQVGALQAVGVTKQLVQSSLIVRPLAQEVAKLLLAVLDQAAAVEPLVEAEELAEVLHLVVLQGVDKKEHGVQAYRLFGHTA